MPMYRDLLTAIKGGCGGELCGPYVDESKNRRFQEVAAGLKSNHKLLVELGLV